MTVYVKNQTVFQKDPMRCPVGKRLGEKGRQLHILGAEFTPYVVTDTGVAVMERCRSKTTSPAGVALLVDVSCFLFFWLPSNFRPSSFL